MELIHKINVNSISYLYTSGELNNEWPDGWSPGKIYTFRERANGMDRDRTMVIYEAERNSVPIDVDESFEPTGESLHISKGILINAGTSAKITLPHANMGIVYGYPNETDDKRTRGYAQVTVLDSPRIVAHGYTIDNIENLVGGVNVRMATADGQQFTINPDVDVILYVVAKNAAHIQPLPIEIPLDHTIIDEPIGFDKLAMHMERHEYHGIGAEVSSETLEFYGVAFELIKSAYDYNIDTELKYDVVREDDVSVFGGVIDLTTCIFTYGDYKSVKAKVGEIGSITTFNNRVGVEIDLSAPKTVNGSDVQTPTWKSIHIPMKHLLYTDISSRITTTRFTSGVKESGNPQSPIPIQAYEENNQQNLHDYIFLPIGQNPTTEFGTFQDRDESNYPLYVTTHLEWADPQYAPDQNHASVYGDGTIANVEIKVNLGIEITNHPYPYDNSSDWYYFYVRVGAVSLDGTTILGDKVRITSDEVEQARLEHGGVVSVSAYLNDHLSADKSIKYFVRFDKGAYKERFECYLRILPGSFVRLTMNDKLPESPVVNADMIFVHDALNIVSHAISENALSVKSNWYQLPESEWERGNITSKANGGSGALKALTNGYKIRGLFTDEATSRNMPASFKSLIESLSALDCIGWGVSNENGSLCVRVERWNWFYKNDVVLTLDNVADISVDIDPDKIPTKFKIGYKKYATSDEYNAIDSPHGFRVFANGIKSLSKEITKECDFIADNYAIEETRRAKSQMSSTQEMKYDSNIFVFELSRYAPASYGSQSSFEVASTAYNTTIIGSFINAKLTPRHMAARWRDYLFATNNTTPFRFTSGELNYKTDFSTIPEDMPSPAALTDYLDAFAVSSPQAEDDSIMYKHAIFKAEKIRFTHPITIAQYRAIRSNPYGLVRIVNSGNMTIEGWILDFKYSLQDGLAEFTLIAKN